MVVRIRLLLFSQTRTATQQSYLLDLKTSLFKNEWDRCRRSEKYWGYYPFSVRIVISTVQNFIAVVEFLSSHSFPCRTINTVEPPTTVVRQLRQQLWLTNGRSIHFEGRKNRNSFCSLISLPPPSSTTTSQ